jgi:hypothetical protein
MTLIFHSIFAEVAAVMKIRREDEKKVKAQNEM